MDKFYTDTCTRISDFFDGVFTIHGDNDDVPNVTSCPRCKAYAKKIDTIAKILRYRCTKCHRIFTDKMERSPIVPQLKDHEIRRNQRMQQIRDNRSAQAIK